MLSDVDESLRRLLTADMPIERGEIDITFERPTREWSSRLSKPTLNLFLFDIRERIELRNESGPVEMTPAGRATRKRPDRRVDLAYTLTAWAKEPADEHRIMGRLMATLYRNSSVPEEHLDGELRTAEYPVLLRMMPPDYLAKPADFWGVMDNEMHIALTWVATAPLDPYAPIEGPIVRTAQFDFGRPDEEWRERFRVVGGITHGPGGITDGVEGVRVTVVGTALSVTSDRDGRFALGHLPDGEYQVRLEPPGGEARELRMQVPAPTYDLPVG
jgi:hypothetical protein